MKIQIWDCSARRPQDRTRNAPVDVPEDDFPSGLGWLPDGRVLGAGDRRICVLEGFPPAAWLRRRTLLMSLRRGAEGAAPAGAAGDVLLRVAALPEALWKGPLIFQYL